MCQYNDVLHEWMDGLIKLVNKNNRPHLCPYHLLEVECDLAQTALACKGLHLWEMALWERVVCRLKKAKQKLNYTKRYQ